MPVDPIIDQAYFKNSIQSIQMEKQEEDYFNSFVNCFEIASYFLLL